MRKNFARAVIPFLCLALCLGVPGKARAAGETAIDEERFPDPAFRSYIGETFDADQNGLLDEKELAAVTELRVADPEVTSLTGLELFPALKSLDCGGVSLPTLDIRGNPALVRAFLEGERTEAEGAVLYDLPGEGAHLRIAADTEIWADEADRRPDIVSGPGGRAVLPGREVSFSVTLRREASSCQWYSRRPGDRLWTPLEGETDTTLAFVPDVDMTGYSYFCAVTGPGGRAVSESAVLAVISKPVVILQPGPVSGSAGMTVSLRVKALGEGLRYQWYSRRPWAGTWTKIADATHPVLEVTVSAKLHGYQYRCQISNGWGTVFSRAARLAVQ